jgi:hypothetical protein
MTPADLLHLAGQFGANGLFIGYLVWKDLRTDKIAEKRIEADKQLASSLSLLTAAVNGRANV